MIRTGLILMCILYNFGAYSQSKKANTTKLDQPKLVVGIVVDQMRYDFLYRYYDRLSENGFKRLINGGVNCINNHYNYTPTNTGPGHATIYAGSPPAINGIAGNDWYERSLGKNIYCTQDTS
ncbi:MAG: alkaline phosphatase family protein, partial [Saprospiraceae bacterium]